MTQQRRALKSNAQAKQPVATPQNFPAPVKGWNTKDSPAQMSPQYALYMENFFPKADSVTLREGVSSHLTGAPLTIKHLMSWAGPTSSKLFACTDGGIYDATSAGVCGASVSTITNGRCVHVNFTGTGGSYLIVVNGTDILRHYNGTTWTTVATFVLGGGTIATSLLNFVNSFKRALYFLKNDSMSFFYLPVDQITGTVVEFPIGALFSKGGRLLSMGNWTLDGGNGPEDYTVFATTEGQLAVYKGSDPSDAADWTLQGVYDLGRPMGNRCFARYGGDLLYLSDTGLWSMQKALSVSEDSSAGTLSWVVNSAFNQASIAYGSNFGWQVILSPIDNMLIVNVPVTEYDTSMQFVMNLNTRAWTKFRGWNATAFELLGNQLYMSTGLVVGKALDGGLDFTNSITAYCKPAPQYLSPRAALKQIQLIRFTMSIEGRYAINAEIDMDFEDTTNYSSPSYSGFAGAVWDEDVWDDSLWGAVPTIRSDWMTIACSEGYAAAPRLRIIGRDATINWFSIDYAYVAGEMQG